MSCDLSRGINKKKEGDVTLTVIRNKSQRSVTVTPKANPTPQPGAAPQGGVRTIVVPRVEIGAIPEMTIRVPEVNVSTPEVKVVVPKIKGPKVRVIRAGAEQPI